jgi:hypothetical protein
MALQTSPPEVFTGSLPPGRSLRSR